MNISREIFRRFAELLEYPGPDLAARARECHALLAEAPPEAAESFAPFVSFVDREPLSRLEEIYTSTFDLSPECCPYVGYQLFGDNPKRGDLMVRLQESYRALGLEVANELPDHAAVVLRFLAETEEEELRRDLLDQVMAPALEKMAKSLDDKNGYGAVVRSAKCVVGGAVQTPGG